MLNSNSIFFLGIGGIGMSALARFFKSSGQAVFGYDRFQSELCKKLESEGMRIHYEDRIELLSKKIDPQNTLIVYTPAIPEDNKHLQYFKDHGFTLIKRARLLGEIANEQQCLAIAGTHGKTTTSSLLAHLFRANNKSISAFLGGISTNYQTNFWGSRNTKILVAEADEYDRSFLNLQPQAAAITSTDADHLDIYGQESSLKATFQTFADSVQDLLLIHEHSGLNDGLVYGLSEEAQYRAVNIRIEAHQYTYDLIYPQGSITNIKLGLPGRYNVENSVAAAGLALHYGLTEEEVKLGLESFKGVKRRFEYHIKQDDLVYIDDYAHHPREIEALALSIRELYPNKKITAIFQAHLFSRTRDFMVQFAESLALFDEVILLEIYPARERPIPGINASALLELIDSPNKTIAARQEIINRFTKEKPEVILTIGAGDIDQLVPNLKMSLLK
jgi:UDP-N-acetylmuramate--alanine ligase